MLYKRKTICSLFSYWKDTDTLIYIYFYEKTATKWDVFVFLLSKKWAQPIWVCEGLWDINGTSYKIVHGFHFGPQWTSKPQVGIHMGPKWNQQSIPHGIQFLSHFLNLWWRQSSVFELNLPFCCTKLGMPLKCTEQNLLCARGQWMKWKFYQIRSALRWKFAILNKPLWMRQYLTMNRILSCSILMMTGISPLGL